jgi:hypothetical protein
VLRLGLLLSAFLLAACQGVPSATAALDASPDPAEAALLFGIRRDAAVDCGPVRDGLPEGAIAAVECSPVLDVVDRVRLYRFTDAAMLLQTYVDWLAVAGVTPRTGDCMTGQSGDSTYVPEDGRGPLIPERTGCFADGSGTTVITVVPPDVLVATHTSAAEAGGLSQWLMRGNQDVPGGPTIWNAAGPMNPEK